MRDDDIRDIRHWSTAGHWSQKLTFLYIGIAITLKNKSKWPGNYETEFQYLFIPREFITRDTLSRNLTRLDSNGADFQGLISIGFYYLQSLLKANRHTIF